MPRSDTLDVNVAAAVRVFGTVPDMDKTGEALAVLEEVGGGSCVVVVVAVTMADIVVVSEMVVVADASYVPVDGILGVAVVGGVLEAEGVGDVEALSVNGVLSEAVT